MERSGEMKTLLDDRHEQVDGDRDPDLSLDGVLGSAEEGLDAEMLLDPFEEEFDLPTTLVERANRCRWKLEMVRQKHQCLAAFRIFETDAPEMVWVALFGKRPLECDGLVA